MPLSPLERFVGWAIIALLVTVIAADAMREPEPVVREAAPAYEPRPAITYGALHLTSRVDVDGVTCMVDEIREEAESVAVVLDCPEREER